MKYVIRVLSVLAVLAVPASADWITRTASISSYYNWSQLGVNPVNGKVYVSAWDQYIYIFDGAGNQLATCYPVPPRPRQVAVNPVTGKAYVVCYGSTSATSIVVIDGTTNGWTTVATTQIGAYAVAVNPVTNRVYVANYDNASVTVIDGATNGIITYVTVGTTPRALAVNPLTNRIYVANQNSANVSVIDGATNTVIATIPVGNYAFDVAVDPVTNSIWVAAMNSHRVTKIDGATNSTKFIPVAPAQGPAAVAVNPAINRVFVANQMSSHLTVIDGADDSILATVTTGTAPWQLALNVATNKVYLATSTDVTVVDGTTFAKQALTTAVPMNGVAVNPITNKAYAAGSSASHVANLVVIDGSSNNAADVTVGAGPVAVGANLAANKVYAVNATGRTVTVIDGATNSTTTVPVGANPYAVAVNPITGRVFVANSGGASVTVIDGATNDTASVPTGDEPNAVAVNCVTNKAYVSCDDGTVTVIEGGSLGTLGVPVGAMPCAVAVNPTTDKIYVANQDSNSVTVIDGPTNVTTTVPVGQYPRAIQVNPVTNRIYVANYNNTVSVINGQTNGVTTVPVGVAPSALAVNCVTNRVYVANFDGGNVTVINGATGGVLSTVPAGINPYAVMVDPVTDKVYVVNRGSNNVTIIDGATNATSTASTGVLPVDLCVNPVTGRVYVANQTAGSVTVLTEVPWSDTRVAAEFDSSAAQPVLLARPALGGRSMNRSTPTATRIEGVLNQRGTAQTAWRWGALAGPPADSVNWTWNWSTDSLIWGENLLCAVPLESYASVMNSFGIGTPFAGNLAVQPVYRAPTRDVAALQIVAPVGAFEPQAVTPQARLRNFGNVRQTTRVYFTISATPAFRDSVVLPSGLPAADTVLSFADWAALPGSHVARCSVFCSGDIESGNDTVSTSFTVTSTLEPGWLEKASMPVPLSGKQVKDGGWLAIEGERIYAAKGNKTADFYLYDTGRDSWRVLASIPDGREGKKPGKGAVGVSGDYIYAVKGNNTQGFYRYDPGRDSWYQLADVPLGATNKKVKGGTDAAYHNGSVYLLKGYKNEFLKYSTADDSWTSLPAAPVGTSGKDKYDKGSWLVPGLEPVLYCHKAKYHELFCYDLARDSWTAQLTGMPFIGASGKKKKSKDGGSAALLGGHIYALKGGNTQEFWFYDPAQDSWRELDTMPLVGTTGKKKKVKAGADIVAADYLYTLKGNKTLEFWRYVPRTLHALRDTPDAGAGVMSSVIRNASGVMRVSPNPLRAGFAMVRWDMTQTSDVWDRVPSLAVYDALGRCVLAHCLMPDAGRQTLDVRTLPAGVYMLKLTAGSHTATQKLVIQR